MLRRGLSNEKKRKKIYKPGIIISIKKKKRKIMFFVLETV